jgi:hypothetical protein
MARRKGKRIAALGFRSRILGLPFFEFGGSGLVARTTKLEKREVFDVAC